MRGGRIGVDRRLLPVVIGAGKAHPVDQVGMVADGMPAAKSQPVPNQLRADNCSTL